MEPYVRNNLVWIRNSLRSNKYRNTHTRARARLIRRCRSSSNHSSPIGRIHYCSIGRLVWQVRVSRLCAIYQIHKHTHTRPPPKNPWKKPKKQKKEQTGGHGDGIPGSHATPPPISGILGSLSQLCHPTLVSLEISMQTPFYFIFMLISHAFVYITYTK